MNKITRTLCDCCGAVNPKTLPNSRVTLCCQVPDGIYCTQKNADGKKVMGSNGKTMTMSLQFPFKWRGFWRF